MTSSFTDMISKEMNSQVTRGSETMEEAKTTVAISASLKRTQSPFYQDLVTPLVKPVFAKVTIGPDEFSINTDREKVLRSVLKLIERETKKFHPVLWDLEESELVKAGPSSLRPSTKWWDSVNAYVENRNLTYDPDCLVAAQQDVLVRIGGILEQGYFMPLNHVQLPGSKFSGAPYCTRTKDALPGIMRDAELLLDKIKRGEDFQYYYSILGHRGQAKGLYSLPKQRVVWMEPKAPVVVGLSWLNTVLPKLRNLPEFVGWNNPYLIDREVNATITRARQLSSNIVSMDFSQFDATVEPVVVEEIFARLSLFPMLRPLLADFFRSPLMLPDGMLAARSRGVPSGHAWTNFIDSLANLVCIYYIAHRTGRHVERSHVLGDDSLVVYDKSVPIELMASIAGELGLKLNPTKSVCSYDHCHFLQKMYFANTLSGGVRSIIRTCNSMITLERWSNYMSEGYNVARWQMQLNEVYAHPARHTFLKWLFNHDKSHLGANMSADEIDAYYNREDDLFGKSWRDSAGYTTSSTTFWFHDELKRMQDAIRAVIDGKS